MHVRPTAAGGLHRIDNGLLLRSDLARLFDLGYLTVTAEGSVRISDRLEQDEETSRPYDALDGIEIWQPNRRQLRPRREFLEWHRRRVYSNVTVIIQLWIACVVVGCE